MLAAPLFLLSTGTILNVVAQFVTDTGFADPKSQLIPWIKFTASLLFAAITRLLLRKGQPQHVPTLKQKRLMMLIGVLDTTAYTCFTLGFTYCGTALSNVILSSTGQIFTAIATRFVLGKRLTNGQLAAITCVMLGLGIRSLPASYFESFAPLVLGKTAAAKFAATSTATGATSGAIENSSDLVTGAALITVAALLYSALGVTYETLVNSTGKPPPYSDVLWNISKLGFITSTAYQFLYTLPRWESLVGSRALLNGYSTPYVTTLLTCFGCMFNIHMFAQSIVFKTEGAIGVGLVNAMRGAVMTVLGGLLFCSSERPWLCMTAESLTTAAITTLGGIGWVLSKPVGPVDSNADKRKKNRKVGNEDVGKESKKKL